MLRYLSTRLQPGKLQAGSTQEPLAHTGKYTSHPGSRWRLAGRAYCPTGVAAQVTEGCVSAYVLDDDCSELFCFRVAFYSAGCWFFYVFLLRLLVSGAGRFTSYLNLQLVRRATADLPDRQVGG